MKREPMPNDLANQVHFRAMTKEDISDICNIEKEAFPTPWTADAFHHELTNNFFAHYLVMVWRDEVIAYGGMWIIRDEAHVTNIAVRTAYRGRRLGDRLMLELMAKAISLGAERMTLEVRMTNYIAQQLYEKHGFRAHGVRRNYYTDNNEDALIMWADLMK